MQILIRNIALFLLPWLVTTDCGAQSREDLKIAPNKVFSVMLKYAHESDSTNLFKSLKHVDPLLIRFEETEGLAFEKLFRSACKNGGGEEIVSLVQRMIFSDITDILRSVERGEIGKNGGVWVKIAYKDYVLLSPYILSQNDGFEQDRLLKNNFRKLMTIHSSESGYLSTSENRAVNEELLLSTIEILKTYLP